jgi:hypothetical protein
MDNSFLAYLQRLELMAFFSGYPLIYSCILFIEGNVRKKKASGAGLLPLLPLSYAVVGALYLGLELNNLRAGHQPFSNLQPISYLKVWGMLSILFLIPALRRRPALSLIHGLTIFLFLAKDLVMPLSGTPADTSIVSNDMKIYTDSLILNLGSFGFVLLLTRLFHHFSKRQKSLS